MKHWTDELTQMAACAEAVKWAKNYETLQSAWDVCERGDWLLWLAAKRSRSTASRKRLVLAACECARLALSHVPVGETRPLTAIETAEKWTRGEATLQDVATATDAVYAAAAYAAAYADAAAKIKLQKKIINYGLKLIKK